jgi:hypothetical protein
MVTGGSVSFQKNLGLQGEELIMGRILEKQHPPIRRMESKLA